MVDGKNIVKRKSIKISRLVSMFVERRKHTNQIVNIETQHISSRIMINLVVYQIVDHITYTHTSRRTPFTFRRRFDACCLLIYPKIWKSNSKQYKCFFRLAKVHCPAALQVINTYQDNDIVFPTVWIFVYVQHTIYVRTIVMLFANDFMMTRRNTF